MKISQMSKKVTKNLLNHYISQMEKNYYVADIRTVLILITTDRDTLFPLAKPHFDKLTDQVLLTVALSFTSHYTRDVQHKSLTLLEEIRPTIKDILVHHKLTVPTNDPDV